MTAESNPGVSWRLATLFTTIVPFAVLGMASSVEDAWAPAATTLVTVVVGLGCLKLSRRSLIRGLGVALIAGTAAGWFIMAVQEVAT